MLLSRRRKPRRDRRRFRPNLHGCSGGAALEPRALTAPIFWRTAGRVWAQGGQVVVDPGGTNPGLNALSTGYQVNTFQPPQMPGWSPVTITSTAQGSIHVQDGGGAPMGGNNGLGVDVTCVNQGTVANNNMMMWGQNVIRNAVAGTDPMAPLNYAILDDTVVVGGNHGPYTQTANVAGSVYLEYTPPVVANGAVRDNEPAIVFNTASGIDIRIGFVNNVRGVIVQFPTPAGPANVFYAGFQNGGGSIHFDYAGVLNGPEVIRANMGVQTVFSPVAGGGSGQSLLHLAFTEQVTGP